MRMRSPIQPVTCYQLVCSVCGVAWDNGEMVPYFNSRAEAEEKIVDIGRGADEDEPLGRVLARGCRIVGCGEAAWDKKFGKKK